MSNFYLADDCLSLRSVEEADKPFIIQKIKDEHFNAMTTGTKNWLTNLSYEDVDIFLDKFDSFQSLIINETYLVIYDVGELWWSDKKVLAENMILRIYNGQAKFSDIMKTLDVLAEINNCGYIDVGTALNKDMDRLNQKFIEHGYEPVQYNLIKKIGE